MTRFLSSRVFAVWLLALSILAIPVAYTSTIEWLGMVSDIRMLSRVSFRPCDFTDALVNFDWLGILHSIGLLFTHQFFHADSEHLLSNIIPLLLFGVAVEKYLGAKSFLFAYLASGVVGALVHWAYMPENFFWLLGASGAVGGILGIFTVMFVTRSIHWGNWHIFLMALMFIIFLLPNFLGVMGKLETQGANVAVILHIGAYVFGLLLGVRHWLSAWKVEVGF